MCDRNRIPPLKTRRVSKERVVIKRPRRVVTSRVTVEEFNELEFNLEEVVAFFRSRLND